MGNKNITDSEDLLRMITEKLGTDILFESFAELLVRTGKFDPENIHIIPKENHKRNYRNDIIPSIYKTEFEPERYFEDNEREFLTMFTSRSSILDYLPEDFYTEPDNTQEFEDEKGEKKSQKEIEAYRKQIKEELKSANRFFRPLEVEYNKVRVRRELFEVEQLESFDPMLESFWGEFPTSNDKWRRFIRTLHLISFIVGDKEKTKALIEYVLGAPVNLTFTIEEYCEMTDEQRTSLMGQERIMGFNMIVGNAVYDYQEVCILKLENLTTKAFFEYFDEQSDSRKLLNEIIKYYFPLNVDVRLDFSINPKKEDTTEEESVVVLGYSSKLGA